MLIFVEEGKPENPEKNPRNKDENKQQTQPTRESNPGHTGNALPLQHTPHLSTWQSFIYRPGSWVVTLQS